MSIRLQPMPKLTKRAEEALIKEIGIVDTLRFLSQFRAGTGDYTAERHRTLEGLSVKEIVQEIKQRRSE
jgi:hypothetical protein